MTRRLREWVAFAETDDAHARAELRRMLVPLPGWMQPSDLATAPAIEIRDELRDILRATVQGKRLKVQLSLTKQVWQDSDVATGFLFSTSSTHTRDLTIERVLQLLQRLGRPKLQICPDPDCARLFVKMTRQEYCSTRCQSRAWMRKKRNDDKREKETRHVTTRTRRR